MNFKKGFVIFLIVTVMVSFSGCKIGEKDVYLNSGSGISNAFIIGSMKCPKKEANLYMGCFADYYGNIGGIDFSGTGKEKEEERLKNSAMALLTRVYSLNLYAEDNELKLSESEVSYCESAAKIFYSKMSGEDRDKIGISEKEIKSAYEKYALALKVYNSLMEGVDGNVTEDEARVMDGYIIHLSDGEKLTEVDKRIRAGDSFSTLTQVYSEGPKHVISFGRGVYPKAFDEAAFSLEDGEISGRIETDDGFYYVQCVSKFDKEKSESNKLVIIDRRQKSLLKQIESEQRDNYYTELNSTYFDGVSPKELKISVGREFFTTIENNIDF